jgi:hypothetical protein
VRRPPKRVSSATVMFHATLGYFRNNKIPGLFFGSERFSMNVKSRRFHPLMSLPSSVPISSPNGKTWSDPDPSDPFAIFPGSVPFSPTSQHSSAPFSFVNDQILAIQFNEMAICQGCDQPRKTSYQQGFQFVIAYVAGRDQEQFVG